MIIDFDDFGEWLNSDEGQLYVEVSIEVDEHLENATVDACAQRIVLPQPEITSLSIEQLAQRIQQISGYPYDTVVSRIVGWLQMSYEPKGLNEQEMKKFEVLIEDWTRPYEIG